MYRWTHPLNIEHFTSSNKKRFQITCFKLNHSYPSTQTACNASDKQLRPVTLFGAESVVQSVNAEGGTYQSLCPISGQSCHQSKVTDIVPCPKRTGEEENNTYIFNTTEYHVARRQQLKTVVIRRITMSSCKLVDIKKHALKKGTQWLSFSGWRSETEVIISCSLF